MDFFAASILFARTTSFFAGAFFRFCYKLREMMLCCYHDLFATSLFCWNRFCFLLEPSFDFAALGEDGCLAATAVLAMNLLLEPLQIFA